MYSPDTSSTSVSPLPLAITELHEMLSRGGADCTLVPSIYPLKFAKNFWNIAWSSTTTLTTYALPALWRPPPNTAAGEVYENGVYLCERTKRWVEEYTLPNMRAVLEEALSVGAYHNHLFLIIFIFGGISH